MKAATPSPEITRLLIGGDTHCNLIQGKYLVDTALDNNCDLIFQLGDFGYFPNSAEGILFLSGISYYAKTHNIPIIWLPGNHEDYTALYSQEWEIDDQGFWKILPAIRYAPRGLRWSWSGIRFLALGGAVSTDKQVRLRWEARAHRPRSLWWPEEAITEGDLHRALDGNDQSVDIMFSHDTIEDVVIPGRPAFVDNVEQKTNRIRVQTVMEHTKPRRLYHGHLHISYKARFVGDGFTTEIVGLGRDGQSFRSWEILDLDKDLVCRI